jgi:hypothetical protein
MARFWRFIPVLLISALLPLSCADQNSGEQNRKEGTLGEATHLADQANKLLADIHQGFFLASETPERKNEQIRLIEAIEIAARRLDLDASDSDALDDLLVSIDELAGLIETTSLATDLQGFERLNETCKKVAQIAAARQNRPASEDARFAHRLYRYGFERGSGDFKVSTLYGQSGASASGFQIQSRTSEADERSNFAEIYGKGKEKPTQLKSWLISPTFDLSAVSQPSISIKQMIKGPLDKVTIGFKAIAADKLNPKDPAGSPWLDLAMNNLPSGRSDATVTSVSASFPEELKGQRVIIACYYEARDHYLEQWKIFRFDLIGVGALGEIKKLDDIVPVLTVAPVTAPQRPAAQPVVAPSAAPQPATGSSEVWSKDFTDAAADWTQYFKATASAYATTKNANFFWFQSAFPNKGAPAGTISVGSLVSPVFKLQGAGKVTVEVVSSLEAPAGFSYVIALLAAEYKPGLISSPFIDPSEWINLELKNVEQVSNIDPKDATYKPAAASSVQLPATLLGKDVVFALYYESQEGKQARPANLSANWRIASFKLMSDVPLAGAPTSLVSSSVTP